MCVNLFIERLCVYKRIVCLGFTIYHIRKFIMRPQCSNTPCHWITAFLIKLICENLCGQYKKTLTHCLCFRCTLIKKKKELKVTYTHQTHVHAHPHSFECVWCSFFLCCAVINWKSKRLMMNSEKKSPFAWISPKPFSAHPLILANNPSTHRTEHF